MAELRRDLHDLSDREKLVEELRRYYAPTEAESTMDVDTLDERGLRREKLVEELRRYYAPTEAESTMDVDTLDEQGLRLRRIRIQRERRERWAKRETDAELWRPLAYEPTEGV